MNPIKLNESCISGACQHSLERPHQGSAGKGGNKNEQPEPVKRNSRGRNPSVRRSLREVRLKRWKTKFWFAGREFLRFEAMRAVGQRTPTARLTTNRTVPSGICRRTSLLKRS